MTVYTNGFTFDNTTSDELGLMVCEFNGNTPSETSGGNIEFTLTSAPIRNRWYKSGNANYSEAIKFEFQVMKQNFEPIDSYEYSTYARLLQRKDDYKEFTITKLDYDTVHFYAQLNISPIQVGGDIMGINITGTTDSPYAYGQMITKKISTENGIGMLKFVDMSDEIGYIYPDIKIDISSACNLKITNETSGEIFKLNNCVNNEIINIDSTILEMTSTALSHKLYEDSNYKFPRIVNDINKRTNIFKVEGNCTLTMKYRPIRKVVI